MLHKHRHWIQDAERRQRVVPGEDVRHRVVMVVQELPGVFPTGLHVDAVFESLEEVAERVQGLQAAFAAQGMPHDAAHETALRSLSGLIAKQGMVLAFDKLFVVGALLFIAVLPLLLLLRGDSSAPQKPVHVDIEV